MQSVACTLWCKREYLAPEHAALQRPLQHLTLNKQTSLVICCICVHLGQKGNAETHCSLLRNPAVNA